MGVFLKYISKNMLERKGRLFLLVFSIAISVALLVASLGLIDAFMDSFTQPARISAEGQNIVIHSNTAETFFSEEDVDPEGIVNLTGRLSLTGIINEDDEVKYVSLVGRKAFGNQMTSGSFEDANEQSIVISDRIANEYKLNVGSRMTIAVNGSITEFTVKGIASNEGMFYSDKAKDFSAVVPYSYLNDLLGAGGKYNMMTAKYSGEGKLKDAVDKFNNSNEKVKAEILVDDSIDGTESITMGLYGMLAMVCIVCVIIICGAFKLIITERLPIIGTFMSQGATRSKMQHILLTEAALYALAGSVFGVALGELGLLLFTRMMAPLKEYGIYPPLEINPAHIIIAVAFALFLSVGSAWLPARSIRKLQVKDVILNRVEQKHKKGAVRFIIGCLLLAAAVAGAFINAQATVDMSPIFMFCGFIGAAMMSRKLIKVISGKLSGLFRGNTTAFLALNNIKSSKILRGNITLLMISLCAVLSIVSIGNSMEKLVVDAYKELNQDYQIYNIIPSNADKTTTELLTERLSEIEGIDRSSITPIRNAYAVSNDYSFGIESADPDKYAEYMQYFHFGSEANREVYAKYRDYSGSGILLSSTVAKHIGKKAGETVEIDVAGKKAEFMIIGLFDGKVYNNGRLALMKPEIIESVFNIKEASAITFRLENGVSASDVEARFKRPVSDTGAVFISNEDMMKQNVENNNMVINILAIFSYLSLAITAIGILNNISISFQQRRKEFAMIASVGMNGSKRRQLVLTESFTSVIWGFAAAIPFTLVILRLMAKMFEMIDLKGEISMNWSSIPLYLAITSGVVLIASLPTMKKSKNLNIVAELKYE